MHIFQFSLDFPCTARFKHRIIPICTHSGDADFAGQPVQLSTQLTAFPVVQQSSNGAWFVLESVAAFSVSLGLNIQLQPSLHCSAGFVWSAVCCLPPCRDKLEYNECSSSFPPRPASSPPASHTLITLLSNSYQTVFKLQTLLKLIGNFTETILKLIWSYSETDLELI